jgi:hypothetical protein
VCVVLFSCLSLGGFARVQGTDALRYQPVNAPMSVEDRLLADLNSRRIDIVLSARVALAELPAWSPEIIEGFINACQYTAAGLSSLVDQALSERPDHEVRELIRQCRSWLAAKWESSRNYPGRIVTVLRALASRDDAGELVIAELGQLAERGDMGSLLALALVDGSLLSPAWIAAAGEQDGRFRAFWLTELLEAADWGAHRDALLALAVDWMPRFRSARASVLILARLAHGVGSLEQLWRAMQPIQRLKTALDIREPQQLARLPSILVAVLAAEDPEALESTITDPPDFLSDDDLNNLQFDRRFYLIKDLNRAVSIANEWLPMATAEQVDQLARGKRRIRICGRVCLCNRAGESAGGRVEAGTRIRGRDVARPPGEGRQVQCADPTARS